MKLRFITTAVLGSMLLGAPVLADEHGRAGMDNDINRQLQTLSPSDQCAYLEKEFDRSLERTGTARNLDDAQSLREEGAELCASNQESDGVAKLKDALRELGATPQ